MAEAAQYACTNCMQWFRFDELSKQKQMCSDCTAVCAESSKVKPKNEKTKKRRTSSSCRFCQTDLKTKIVVNGDMCDRCGKNYKERGEPSKCTYCKLPSAFIGSKCQRCSSSQKKYGNPVSCQNCDLKAAFDHSKARLNGLLLCWLCYVAKEKEIRKGKRKADVKFIGQPESKKTACAESEETSQTRSPSPGSCHQVWRDLLCEDKDYRPPVKPKENDSEENKRLSSDRTSRNELRRKAQLNSKHIADRKHFDRAKRRKSSLDARLETFGEKLSAGEAKAIPDVAVKKEHDKPSSGQNTPRLVTPPVGNSPSTPTLGLASKDQEKMKNGSSLDIGGFPFVNDNIVVVTKLREEVNSLKKQLAKKDQQLLEKDKQISMLKVNHLQEERSLQAKLKSQEEEFLKSREAALAKNHELLKKIAQLSKGKKSEKVA